MGSGEVREQCGILSPGVAHPPCLYQRGDRLLEAAELQRCLAQLAPRDRLGELLHRPLFSYANVPYKIKPFAALLENAKDTVRYDHDQAARIEERVAALGSTPVA